MEDNVLTAHMLGSFSVSLGNQEINDDDNRARRVWLLLAYLVYFHDRIATQEELTRLLWDTGEESSNPANALKTALHRVRSMLDQLEPRAGHTLIVRAPGGYSWNPKVSLSLDVERFETLVHAAAAEEEESARLSKYRQALSLYKGDFLSKLSSEAWVTPIAAYYHNLYVQAVCDTLRILDRQKRHQDIVDLCTGALAIEPYHEELYRCQIRSLMDLGRHQEAVASYEQMTELFFTNFGTTPSNDLRQMYKEASALMNGHSVSIDELSEQLQESGGSSGALLCEYEFFKTLYQAQARMIARTGDTIHVGLITVSGPGNEPLPKRSLQRVMDNLQEELRTGLRRGDVASRCSSSQFILMLLQANFENSGMVCARILKNFRRKYPHSPAEMHFTVQPLEPSR